MPTPNKSAVRTEHASGIVEVRTALWQACKPSPATERQGRRSRRTDTCNIRPASGNSTDA